MTTINNSARPLYTLNQDGIYEVLSSSDDFILTVRNIKTEETLQFPHDKLLPLQTFLVFTKSEPEEGAKEHEVLYYDNEGRVRKSTVNGIVAIKWIGKNVFILFSDSFPCCSYICKIVDDWEI